MVKFKIRRLVQKLKNDMRKSGDPSAVAAAHLADNILKQGKGDPDDKQKK